MRFGQCPEPCSYQDRSLSSHFLCLERWVSQTLTFSYLHFCATGAGRPEERNNGDYPLHWPQSLCRPRGLLFLISETIFFQSFRCLHCLCDLNMVSWEATPLVRQKEKKDKRNKNKKRFPPPPRNFPACKGTPSWSSGKKLGISPRNWGFLHEIGDFSNKLGISPWNCGHRQPLHSSATRAAHMWQPRLNQEKIRNLPLYQYFKFLLPSQSVSFIFQRPQPLFKIFSRTFSHNQGRNPLGGLFILASTRNDL